MTRDRDLAADRMHDTLVGVTRAVAGYRGGSRGEVAEVLDRSPGACRVLLHHARRAFHAAYLEEGGHAHR